MKSLVKNAADVEQVEKAEKKEKFTRESELQDIRAVLASPGGRRVFWRLLGFCHINGSSWNGSPNEMLFNEGERNIGLRIQSDIQEADVNAFFTMIQEAKKEELENA